MPVSKHNKKKRTHKQWLKHKNKSIAERRYKESPKRDKKND